MTIKGLIKNINQKEWLFLGCVTIAIILLTTFPFVYRQLTTPEDDYYLGVPQLNRMDYFNYFSYIEQARQGNFLFENFYTTEKQSRIIFNPFFLILGLIAKVARLSAVITFQLARIILIPVFIFIYYLFLSFLLRNKLKQKICLAITCFAGGLGIFLLSFDFSLIFRSMEFWIPEAITFLSLYTNALFIFSLSLIVFVLLLMLMAIKNKKYKYSVLAGLTGLILFQSHPYHMPTIFAILGIFCFLVVLKQKKYFPLKHLLIFTIISTPTLVYYYWMSSHWLTIHRISQAIPLGYTPSPLIVFISYGLLLPWTIIGWIFLLKKQKKQITDLFLIIWLPVHIILIYSPIPLQRRLIEGLHLIICILATIGLFVIGQKIKNTYLYKKWLTNTINNKTINFVLSLGFLILIMSSNVLWLYADSTHFFRVTMTTITQDEFSSLQWIKQNTPQTTIILASDLDINNIIPGMALRKVYIGHICETLFCKNKIQQTKWFWETNDNDQKKIEFLRKNNINYLVDCLENNIFQPQAKDYLEMVFKNNTISVYHIK